MDTRGSRGQILSSIVFIQSPAPELRNDRLEPNLGLLYLATYMKNTGFFVEYLDLSGVPSENWADNLKKSDIYCFSTFSPTYQRTLQIKNLCKTINPKGVFIAGGPHASALPEAVAKDFDYVVVGEGEKALKRVVQEIPESRTKSGIVYGDPITNLDLLPFPDYTLVDLNSYGRVVNGMKSVSVLTSRGCPFHCVFCNSIVMGAGKPRDFEAQKM